MSLPWVRLDSNIFTHDKVLNLLQSGAAGRSALVVYVFGLSYSGGHSTDGLIEFAVLPVIHGRKKDAELLVDVALWKPHPLGWEVPNWLDRQQSSNRQASIVAARRKGAVKANCIRWHGPDCGCWADG